MKKILVAILAVTLMASPALAANDGPKKKAKKQAKIERRKDKCCDPTNCDPTKCDPKCCDLNSCDPKACEPKASDKDEKCTPTTTCAGNK